jgi:hypothetical protein
MKVKELIKLLEKEPQDLEVVLFNSYEYEHDIVTEARYIEPSKIEAGWWSQKDIEKANKGALLIQ